MRKSTRVAAAAAAIALAAPAARALTFEVTATAPSMVQTEGAFSAAPTTLAGGDAFLTGMVEVDLTATPDFASPGFAGFLLAGSTALAGGFSNGGDGYVPEGSPGGISSAFLFLEDDTPIPAGFPFDTLTDFAGSPLEGRTFDAVAISKEDFSTARGNRFVAVTAFLLYDSSLFDLSGGVPSTLDLTNPLGAAIQVSEYEQDPIDGSPLEPAFASALGAVPRESLFFTPVGAPDAAVPLPATLPLLAGALALAGLRARRPAQ